MNRTIPPTVGSHGSIIIAELERSRGQWVPMPFLARVAKSGSVHSAIAYLRKRGYRIDNKQERDSGVRKSYYRLANAL